MMNLCVFFFFLFDDIIDLFDNSNVKISINDELNKLYKNEEVKGDCTICTDKVEIGYIILKCSHIFHKECIKEWFNVNQTCPLCRADFIGKITKLLEIEKSYDLRDSQKIIFEDSF